MQPQSDSDRNGIAGPPPEGGWSLSDRGGSFIQLVGPVYTTRTGLESGEPARFGFRVGAQHCNVRMVCHGGMLATFLDVALACALRELPDVSGPLPTISMTLDYLDPAPCEAWIESRVTVSKLGGSIGFAQALLMGPHGPVLRGSGVYKRSHHGR
jgi:acyl-coenzyme A thioesterase PaaI-like protein